MGLFTFVQYTQQQDSTKPLGPQLPASYTPVRIEKKVATPTISPTTNQSNKPAVTLPRAGTFIKAKPSTTNTPEGTDKALQASPSVSPKVVDINKMEVIATSKAPGSTITPKADSAPKKVVLKTTDALQEVKPGVSTTTNFTFTKPLPPHYYHISQPHLLQIKNTNPLLKPENTHGWVFFLLFLALSVFSFIRIAHSRSLRQIRDAFFSITISNQIVRDDNMLLQSASVLLSSIFYFALSLFIYQLSIYYRLNIFNVEGLQRFIVIMLVVSIVYFVKQVVLRLAGAIFKVEKALNAYNFTVVLINNMLGLCIIPVLIFLFFMPVAYQPGLLLLTAIIIFIAYLYRIFRGISIGYDYQSFSAYYLFLYLCTLELAPLLFLYKIVQLQRG